MMVVVTRVLMPIANRRRHLHLPAGPTTSPAEPFVAGLVVAIALLMQYMASGLPGTQARKRIEYHTMIGRRCSGGRTYGCPAPGLRPARFLTSA